MGRRIGGGRSRRRRQRHSRRRYDPLGRDTTPPSFFRRHPTGQQCNCDVEEFNIKKSKDKIGYSDSLVRYMLLECPDCGEPFAWSKYLVEG